MDILLLRHGIAVERGTLGYPNDDRPLTSEGIRKMQKAAGGMARLVDQIDLILTSPLQRARKTAEIVADAMRDGPAVKECDELLPGGAIDRAIALLARFADHKAVMLVGHNPEMPLYAAALLGPSRPLLEFKKGALCLIRIQGTPGSKPGMLLWHLTSKQLRQIASSEK